MREETILRTFALILLVSAQASAQTLSPCLTISPEAAKSQFEAVSLKPAEPYKPGTNPFSTHGGPGSDDPGRFTMSRAALSVLISRAYGLDSDQLKGASWVYDAMNNGFALVATLPASTTQEQYCGMLRNMLSGRFHLVFHFEKQSRSGYELTVLPAGPKFKHYVPDPDAPGDRAFRVDERGFPIIPASQPTALSMAVSRTGVWKVSFRNNMSLFARSLASDINQSNGVVAGPGVALPRVVDKTRLAGTYDIRLEFAGQPFPSETAATPATPDPTDAGPNIFTAVQQQLGLKLTKVADVQIDVMIIDHIDRIPTEN
jgi:uncharacterized protein (TIGR03435 family)